MKRDGFTIITPTGDRPLPFELCCKYILRQTVQPTEWIVVDDGDVPTTIPNFPWIKHIIREKIKGEPKHSLRPQMIEALHHVTTDRVLIIEDDDWYSPKHCETLLNTLKTFDLTGQINCVYYHIPCKCYFLCKNKDRASWCQTGFHSSLIPRILEVCNLLYDPFIDLHVWRMGNVNKGIVDPSILPLCIGMKGLPGRQGTTMGWTRPHMFTKDLDGSILRAYIGDDADLYRRFQQ
jgi:hypothetical protein